MGGSLKLMVCCGRTGLIESLVDGACDREKVARDAISKSLTDIGRRKHALVLDIMHGYLAKHNKVRVHLLQWL